MNKILLLPVFLLWSCLAFAQLTVELTIVEVGVRDLCDSDGLGFGESDVQWVASVMDSRGASEDFDHEIENFDGPEVYAAPQFQNPLEFSATYNGICPPNFLAVEFWGCDDDDGGVCNNTFDDLYSEFQTTIPVPTVAGVTNPYFEITAPNCDQTGNVTYSFSMQMTVTGTPNYTCADSPCLAAVQPIQDGCGGMPLDTTRYEISSSSSTFPGSLFNCPNGNGGGDNDIFFQFVAPPSGEILIKMTDYDDGTLFGFTDVTLNLMEGACEGLVPADAETYTSTAQTTPAAASCMDLSGGAFNDNYSPYLISGMTPGQTYFLRASEDDDDNAFMDLSFQAIVENDACANPVVITTSPVTGCNFNATDRDEPDNDDWTGPAHSGTFANGTVQTCTGWALNDNMVWYAFEVTADTPQPITVTIDNIVCTGGAENLQMGIWYQGAANACDIANYTGVGCDTGTGLLSVTLPGNVPAGNYLLGVDGNSGAQCTYEISSEQLDAGPSCVQDDYYSNAVVSGVYQTGATIGSDGSVAETENVSFLSNCISLDPEFSVALGAEFLADIDPCAARAGNTIRAGFDVENDALVYTYGLSQKEGVKLELTSKDERFEMLLMDNFKEFSGLNRTEIKEVPDGIYFLKLTLASGDVVRTKVLVKRP